MDAQTLADVLALSADHLTLDHATVAVAPDRILVSSAAQILGRPGFVSLVIAPAPQGLRTSVSAGLSNLTLSDMAGLGWFDHALDLSRAPALRFPTVSIAAASEKGQVRITAPLPAGALLTAAPFSLADAQLDVTVAAAGADVFPLTAAVTALAGSDAMPVRLALPTAFSGWILQTAPGAAKSFASLASDLDGFLGLSVSGLLPPGLPGGFALSDLSCEFSTSDAALTAASLTIGTTESWRILPGTLEVDSMALTLRARHPSGFVGADPGWTYDGVLRGSFALFGTPVQLVSDLGLSTLALSAQPGLTFPGLGTATGQISALLGGGDFSSALPPALANLASVTVESFSASVDVSTPRLLSAGLVLSKPQDLDWTFPFLPGLTVVDARIALQASDPLDSAKRSISGFAQVTGQLGQAEAVFSVERDTGAPTCSISLASEDGITLPDLLGLVGLDQAGFSAALPASLSIVSDFGLQRLNVTHDIAAGRASQIEVGLGLSDTWRIIPGHLELPALDLDLVIRRPSADPADRTIAARLSGEVEIGGAAFAVSASTVTDDADGWLLRGAMAAGSPVPLTDVVSALLPSGISYPQQFPTVTLDAAAIEVATGTLAARASFASSVHWAPTIAGKPADMARLSLDLDVQQPLGDGTRPHTLTVAGTLALSPLPTLSAVCRTGSGTTQTEILAVLTPADLQALSLDNVAANFVGPTASLSSAPAPAGFAPPSFTSAAFYANLTDQTLVLFGQASRFGSAAFLIRSLPAPADGPSPYGAALVLNTAPGFRFADILPDGSALRPVFSAIDSVIEVEEASLSLSSFDIAPGTDNPFAAMNRLAGAAAGLPTPVPIPAVPATVQVKAGLNLDAKLKISTDSLWQGFKYLIESRADAPIALHAWFDPNNPGASRFEASLGGFTILRTITFDRVDLVYLPNVQPQPSPPEGPNPPPSPQAAPTLTLNCAGSLSIPTYAAPSQDDQRDTADTTLVRFTGDLAVTGTGALAVFTAQTGSTLRRPLGIPGLTLNSVAIAIDYAFTARADGGVDRTLTRLAAQGSITLASVVDLTASVLFIAGVPQIVLVELTKTKPVTINDIFNQCIGTDAFSALPALTFTTGWLYQAQINVPAAGTQPAYKQGFHLAAGVTVFDTDFWLELDIVAKDGVRGAAATHRAVDFGFVTLTGPSGGDTGPGLSVRALKSTGDKVFSLDFGFELFGLNFTNGSIAYQTSGSGSETTYAGSITCSGSTPFGTDPSLTVEWTRTRGFRVLNWPGDLPIKDLTQLFEAATADSPCGALTSLGLTDNFIQGACKSDIKISAGTPQHNSDGTTTPVADVDFDLRYEISVSKPGGGDRIVLNPNVTPIKVTFSIVAPKDYSLASLLEKVVEAAADAVAAVLKAVVDDPTAMVAFVGALALSTLSNEAINALVCRNIDCKELKDEYNRRHEGDEGDSGDEADNQLDEANSQAAAAEAAATVEGAADAALAVATCVVAIGGFFASLLAAITHLFGKKTAEEERKDRINAAARAAQERADAAVRAKLAIGGLSVGYQGDNRLHVAWNGVEGDLGYIVSASVAEGPALSPNDGIPGLPQGGTEAVFENAAIRPGATVTVSVAAVLARGERVWRGADAVQVYAVDDFGPHAPVAEIVEGVLRISWSPGSNPATGWSISGQVAGDTAATAISATLQAGASSWSAPAFTPDKLYSLTIAPAGASYSDLPAAIPLATTSQPAPSGVAPSYDAAGDALTVAWIPAPGQAGARVQVRTAAGLQDRTVAAADTSCTFQGLPGAATSSVRVGALGAQVGGVQPVDWSVWLAFAPSIPAAPTVLSAVYKSPSVFVAFAGVPEATSYEARLLDDAQPTPNSRNGAVSGNSQAGFLATFVGPFTAGAILSAELRARNASAAGCWGSLGPAGSASQLTIVDIAAPTGLSAVNGDNQVHLAWTPVSTAADGYELLVTDEAGVALLPQPAQQPGGAGTAASVEVDASGLEDGAAYAFEVRAKAGHCYSPAATARLVRAPEHPGEFLSVQNTLPPPAPGEDPASATLTATILNPAAADTISIARGENKPLGALRVSLASVLRAAPRADGLTGLVKATIAVTALGGRATFGWSDLEAGRPQPGSTLSLLRGYRLDSSEVWSDAPPASMARALAATLVSRPLLAAALMDAYPDLSAKDLGGVLAGFGDNAAAVAGALFAVRDRYGPDLSARLSALLDAFSKGRPRPAPQQLLDAFFTAEGDVAPTVRAQTVFKAFASIGPEKAGVLAALALQAAGILAEDALSALTVVLGSAAAAARDKAYGPAQGRFELLLPVLASLGFDPVMAVSAAGGLPAAIGPQRQASAIVASYPQLTLYLQLRLLMQGGSNAETASQVLGLAGNPDPVMLAIALKALWPSPSETAGLKAAAAGTSAGEAAKALRDAYQPTGLQIGSLLVDALGLSDPRAVGQTLRSAGVGEDEAAASLAELFPWLSADERLACCNTGA